jgi:6-phosphogluconolactonase (cycloisomerase 2 family)
VCFYLVYIIETGDAPSGLKLVAKDLSPSWVALSKDNKFLYAVNEINTYGADKSGSITAYAVDAASGALKKLNTVDSGGPIPCYVSIDPSGKFLLVANQRSDNVVTFNIDAGTGRITPTGHNHPIPSPVCLKFL